MGKNKLVRIVAFIMAALMPLLGAHIAVSAAPDQAGGASSGAAAKYASPDINALTGHGEEPEELSVTAAATYQEKAWYEYVMYSDHAVSSYRVDDDTRIIFYDPYTYTNSLVMDVQFDASTTQFDTMSSYTISHTKSKTISSASESTYTNTSAIQSSGVDKTGSTVNNTGTTKTIYNHQENVETTGTKKETTKNEYHYKEYQSEDWTFFGEIDSATALGVKGGGITIGELTSTETITIKGGADKKVDNAWMTDYTEQTHTTEYSPDYKTSTKTQGDDIVEYNTVSSTDGWTQLSDRVTKTIGSSISTNTGWSETESTTVTKTYAATHFASDGVTPLPWAIVHYQVQMPMKCSLQVKYSGEWVTMSTVYCLLTTVQGTCRSWMQNGQVYYEDWGNGEPVVATDFWSQFTTKENLIKAYQDKLYPVGGEN